MYNLLQSKPGANCSGFFYDTKQESENRMANRGTWNSKNNRIAEAADKCKKLLIIAFYRMKIVNITSFNCLAGGCFWAELKKTLNKVVNN